MEKITKEDLIGRVANALVVYFYKVDARLDESDLDAFHDKSVAKEFADKYAKEMVEAIMNMEIIVAQ